MSTLEIESEMKFPKHMKLKLTKKLRKNNFLITYFKYVSSV